MQVVLHKQVLETQAEAYIHTQEAADAVERRFGAVLVIA